MCKIIRYLLTKYIRAEIFESELIEKLEKYVSVKTVS